METAGVIARPEETVRDEAELIRAAQRADQDAFERLVCLYDRSVLGVALRLLRSEEDARDAYQEAFLRAYRGIQGFRFQCSFHTWLYRITTNVCLDHLRKKKIRRECASRQEGTGDGPALLEQVPDHRAGSNPERVLSGRQASQSIQLALEGLSPSERMVFQYRHYEGLRLRAIGKILSMSEAAAKNCLFRAHRKMRASLKDVPR